MKHSLLILILVVFMNGCGSSKKLAEPSELDKITNDDFKPKTQVLYQVRTDFHQNATGLNREGLSRLSSNQLVDFKNSGDPISKIVAHCYAGEYDEAFKVADARYPYYKKNALYWNQIGTCYLTQGKIKKALLYFNKSRDLNSRFTPPLNNLGVIYLMENKDQKALLAFQKASRLRAYNLIPQFNTAQIYLKYGFYGEAEKIFNRIYRQKNDDWDVISGLATCKLMQGNPQLALDFYKRIPAEKHSRADIGLNYAVALRMTGKVDEAKALFDKISDDQLGQLKPYFFRVKDYLGK